MKHVALGIVMIAVCTIGCNQTNEVVETQRPRISMTFSNLPHLREGEGHYQLWAKFIIFSKTGKNDSPQHDSTAVSLGEFNVSEDGRSLTSLDGSRMRFTIPTDQNPQLIDDIILSIERDGPGLAKTQHESPGPAFLGGKVHGDASVGVADLDVSYSHALGSSFFDVAGKYTIVAPTSPADSNSGVWFVQQGTDSVGLRNLPILPAGWIYEGWAGLPLVGVHGQELPAFQYFSTGKFLRPDSADFDGAGPGRGPGVGYNLPGQDFINPPGGPVKPDLRVSVSMVTVEPVPDNAPGPFSLRLLSTPLPSSLLPRGQAIRMDNVAAASFPRARITIVRAGY